MAIYAISDLHLSLGVEKPMDVFGPLWAGHVEKIRANWDALVREEDIVLLAGDLSWAMRLPEAMPDLEFISQRPGTKVLIRGNHDYWWQRRATTRIQRTVDRNLIFLQGTCVMFGDVAVAGTRGWRLDWGARGEGARSVDQSTVPRYSVTSDEVNANLDRVLLRELAYLERALKSIPDGVRLRIAMLHYPPFDERLQPNKFAELLSRYSADILVYGHVHLGLGSWIDGAVGGVQYRLVSADVVNFTPVLITS